MDQRVISAQASADERQTEFALRPTTLAEYVGQSQVKAQLAIFIAAAKGLHWMSPRGPISIDPLTRDIVQTIYIRKVEWVKGKLQNVEIDKFADVHDPGKKG